MVKKRLIVAVWFKKERLKAKAENLQRCEMLPLLVDSIIDQVQLLQKGEGYVESTEMIQSLDLDSG